MRNKTAFNVALGGICTALCLAAMFCSGFLPMLDYTIPAITGFIMVIVAVETSMKEAVITYCAVSFLSFFITPNKEATLLFVMFMGYYPILKIHLDKMKNKVFSWIIRLGIFNGAVILFFFIFQYIFTNGDMLEGLEMFGRFAPLILLMLANVVFLLYDYALGLLTSLYANWFRKKILRRR